MVAWSQRVRRVVAGSAVVAAVATSMAPTGAAASPPVRQAAAAPRGAEAAPELADVRHRAVEAARGPSSISSRGTATAPQSRAARPRCFGRAATIVGTRRSDRIRGTRRADVIVGGPGADRIIGLGGGDLVCGSGGADYVVPGGGSDRVDGGTGPDTLAVSAGRDRLAGGRGSDWLDYRGSRKRAVVSLGKGRATGERWTSLENVVGTRFADRITGSAAGNQLRGGRGDDLLAGADGDDLLIGQAGNDRLDGGGGALDLVAHPTSRRAVTVDMATGRATGEGTDTFTGMEGAIGSRRDDILRGGSAVAILSGGPGDDTIVGSGASDVLLPLAGGARVDLLRQTAAGEGADTVSGIEVVVGTPGADVLVGSDADEIFLAGGGKDTVSGGGGSDVLLGGNGADDLSGDAGDDVLRGDDAAAAGDRLDGGPGTDVADYGASATGVSVSLQSGSGPAGDTIGSVEMVSGSPHADALTGDDATNTLMGGAGDDAIAGGAGNDVLAGGDGGDTVAGEAGDDYLTGEGGGGAGNGGPGTDVCVGLSPADECEASELPGGQAPGGAMAAAAREAGSTEAARTARRAPGGEWLTAGNPLVSCNDGLPSYSAVVTAVLPARVVPDYSSANRQTVWLRQEIFDLANPNTALQTGQWFYNVLDPGQWTTGSWYLYQGLGNDPVDAWQTTFGRSLQTNYAVVYDMWWQDNYTGEWLYHSRFRAWHQQGSGLYADRCAAQAMGYFNGAPSASTPSCSYTWSDAFCASWRALASSFQTGFIYPSTTFRVAARAAR
jgi:Ca2+-binding RTX toxin-like protein